MVGTSRYETGQAGHDHNTFYAGQIYSGQMQQATGQPVCVQVIEKDESLLDLPGRFQHDKT
jgi:hypothetical protein